MTAATLTAATTAAIGGKAFWYLTRSSGLVALVLLSATLVLGVVSSVGWTTERWPRFLSQDVHRNVSLLGLVFVGVHVATTVLDGYVPINWVAAFVPFVSPYRPIYVGLGALAFDLMLAVLITSGLRHRIGYASWRFVHWLAYLCWPVAVVHALGTGSDTQLPVVLFVEVVCTAVVLGAFAWRMATGRSLPLSRRAAAAAGAVVMCLVIAGFALLGPLRPGWSHRSGTSPALLAQLAAKNGTAATGTTTPATGGTTTPTTAPTASGGSAPAVPFTSQLSGTQTQTGPDSQGTVTVTLALHLQDAASTPLTVTLIGAQSGGGVSLSSGTATFAGRTGTIVGLNGGTVIARFGSPSPMTLTLQLEVDQQSGAISGTVSGTSGSDR